MEAADGHAEENIDLEEGRGTGPRWAQLEQEVGVSTTVKSSEAWGFPNRV